MEEQALQFVTYDEKQMEIAKRFIAIRKSKKVSLSSKRKLHFSNNCFITIVIITSKNQMAANMIISKNIFLRTSFALLLLLFIIVNFLLLFNQSIKNII